MGSRIKETWIIIKEMFIKGADVPCGGEYCKWANQYSYFKRAWRRGGVSSMEKGGRGGACYYCEHNGLRFTENIFANMPNSVLLRIEDSLDGIVACREAIALKAASLREIGLNHRVCPSRSN